MRSVSKIFSPPGNIFLDSSLWLLRHGLHSHGSWVGHIRPPLFYTMLVRAT